MNIYIKRLVIPLLLLGAIGTGLWSLWVLEDKVYFWTGVSLIMILIFELLMNKLPPIQIKSDGLFIVTSSVLLTIIAFLITPICYSLTAVGMDLKDPFGSLLIVMLICSGLLYYNNGFLKHMHINNGFAVLYFFGPPILGWYISFKTVLPELGL